MLQSDPYFDKSCADPGNRVAKTNRPVSRKAKDFSADFQHPAPRQCLWLPNPLVLAQPWLKWLPASVSTARGRRIARAERRNGRQEQRRKPRESFFLTGPGHLLASSSPPISIREMWRMVASGTQWPHRQGPDVWSFLARVETK